jgi:hypothetical protein
VHPEGYDEKGVSIDRGVMVSSISLPFNIFLTSSSVNYNK